MKDRLVKNWMTTDVVTVKPKARMLDAHKLMRANKIRRVPVVKGGKVVGIIIRRHHHHHQPEKLHRLRHRLEKPPNNFYVPLLVEVKLEYRSPQQKVKIAKTASSSS